LDLPLDSEHARHLVPCLPVMWDGCGGSMPKRGQEMVCNRVSHRCLLRRLHQERSRGHQMVPREPSDIARIGMLGAKRELLKVSQHFHRVAVTRAKARALRDALGVGLVAVEELSESE